MGKSCLKLNVCRIRSGSQYTQENDKKDEQSALAQILNQNAREVIDVTSNENIIESHEYHDRARQYRYTLPS